MVAAAKAVAAWPEGKEKSFGQERVGISWNWLKLVETGLKRWKRFFKPTSANKKVKNKETENKMINFLSFLLIPGYFFSSRIATPIIIKIQINIELPFKEKKEKKLFKKRLWGIRFFKNKVIDWSSKSK